MRGTEHGFSKFMTSTGKSNVEGPMSEFLDSYVEDLDALSKFGVDMDDLRVRECSTDEFEANNRWIHKNLFLQQLKVQCFVYLDSCDFANKKPSGCQPASIALKPT